MDFNFQQYLVYILPGFLTVWIFRYFTKSKKKGDFELLGLSMVCGFILFVLLSLAWWYIAVIAQFILFLFNSSDFYENFKNKRYKKAFVVEVITIIILGVGLFLLFKYKGNYEKFPENEYAVAIISSVHGCIFGFIGAHISKTPLFRKIIDEISPKQEN